MQERFERIYADNEWQYGSGEGSLPIHTKGYIRFIESFVANHEVKSVVDLGCGDWQFSRYIDWGMARYRGFDIVRTIIDKNTEQFSSGNIEFHLSSGNPAELPDADLLIAKDVLQHWSNANVEAFLPLLERYRFSLLTNCVNPQGTTLNADIQDGAFRYLDLTLPPFNLAAAQAYSFTNHRRFTDRLLFRKPRWHKITLLVSIDTTESSSLANTEVLWAEEYCSGY